MRILSTLFLYLLLSLPTFATENPSDRRHFPRALEHLVAENESVLAHEAADLNRDGLEDHVFIVEYLIQAGDDKENYQAERRLKIAIGISGGPPKVVKESSEAVLCAECGGNFGDPLEGLSASNGTFSVHHYGGGVWRWAHTYTFNYSRRDDTWQLVEVAESSYNAFQPDKWTHKTYHPPRSFGKIDIAEFEPGNFKGVGKK